MCRSNRCFATNARRWSDSSTSPFAWRARVAGIHRAADHPQGHQAASLPGDASDNVKIIDFGIATRLSSETQVAKSASLLDGTLAYMSPEQTGRMNRSLDRRTDLYSLGVSFYQLLTGRLPFEASDPLELVHSHIARAPATAARAVAGGAAAGVRHRPQADGQGGGGSLPERERAEGGPRGVRWRRLRGRRRRSAPSRWVAATPPASCRFPQKLYGRDAEVGDAAGRVRGRAPRRLPGCCSSPATPASARARWSTRSTSRWSRGGAFVGRQVRPAQSRRSPSPPWRLPVAA